MTESIRPRGAILAVAAAAVLAVGLAGCTGGAGSTPTKTPKATSTAKAVAKPGLTETTHAPGSGENLVGAVADTKVTSCAQKGDGWTVAGTATNPTDAAVDYRIYISLLDKSNDTRALVETDLDGVAAKASQDWSKDIAVTDKNLTCVLRVERYETAPAKK
jgi:hypothetical protein